MFEGVGAFSVPICPDDDGHLGGSVQGPGMGRDDHSGPQGCIGHLVKQSGHRLGGDSVWWV